MKKINLLIGFIAITISVSAQNVGIGAPTPAGKLHVKGSADVSQLIIDANSAQSNTNPLIKLRNSAGSDLMWIHSDNINNTFIGLNAGRVNNAGGGGTFNTFIGSSAGYSNTTGHDNTANGVGALLYNTSGYQNIATGGQALAFNTTASRNTAIGFNALYTQSYSNSNTPWSSNNVAVGNAALFANQPTSTANGIKNTAVGDSALFSNTTGYNNTATGSGSLFSNNIGWENTANGYQALYSNTIGFRNIANGYQALYNNTNGIFNTANGYRALYNNGGGDNNTAFGAFALDDLVEGNANTAVGNSTRNDAAGSNNNTLIGAFAHIGLGASNSVVLGYAAYTQNSNLALLGSTTTTLCGGYANWTNYWSDGRFKTAVQENVKGLDFIMRLRPVTYNMNVRGFHDFQGSSPYGKGDSLMNSEMRAKMDDAIAKKESIRMSGFIAQEVEKAAEETGYDFDGLKKPSNDKDNYGMSYATFVVPLVKAMQEQQKIIEDMKKEIEELKKLIKAAK